MEEETYEELIKMETEIIGGSSNMEELLQMENEDSGLDLGNAVEELVNKNSGEVCENCKVAYKDYCMNCGHLIHILDNKTQLGTYGRAMRSIPKNIFKIKGSLMEGYGVYALRDIPKGVKFGPYEGLETLGSWSKMCLWQIRYLKLIESHGEDYCNWMRFINCTTTQPEQNLIALQFMGNIYYKTLREIQIGEELLIYYGNCYCDDLGFVQYYQPDAEEINENIFKCLSCCFGFSEERYLVYHNRVCPYKKKITIEVNSSSGVKDIESHPKSCERVSNLSSNHQRDKENGKVDKEVYSDVEENGFQQDCIEHVTINDEKEKLNFSHGYNNCPTTGTPKKQLTPKDDDKKRRKRERNNIAAIKSRLKLRERVTNIVTESEMLEKENVELKAQLLTLQNEQYNLLTILENHQASCQKNIPRTTTEVIYNNRLASLSAITSNQPLNHQKDKENGNVDEKVDLDVEEKEFQQICIEHVIINDKEEKEELKFLHSYNDCLTSDTLKQQVIVHQEEYEIDYGKGVKPKFEHNGYPCQATEETSLLPTEKKYECNYKANKLTLREKQCNECSYVAARKGDLTPIKASHARQKSYKCNECSYAAA